MDIFDERLRKYKIVMEEYAERKSQEEVAEKYGMSVEDVRKVTSDKYKHGVATGKEPLCLHSDMLAFLDKYDF